MGARRSHGDPGWDAMVRVIESRSWTQPLVRVMELGFLIRLRRLVLRMRTEGPGPVRESAAIGTGVFIGCLPVYGLHLLLCVAVGTVLRLNRLKMYLAANISNPFVAPVLVFLEIQAGAWLRRGAFHSLTVEAVETTGLAIFGADLLVGSVAVGAVLAGTFSWLTYALVREDGESGAFAEFVRLASDRYIETGVMAWEFARGKLRTDPIYKAAACGGLLAGALDRTVPAADDPRGHGSGRTLLDVGCGLGLTLALLTEVRRAAEAGTWPAEWPSPPCFDRMVGIEARGRTAARASAALAGDAEIITADACEGLSVRAHVVLLFDVLHMMPEDKQDTLLASMASALEPDGLMLIREADAAAGWRFTTVRWGNRLKALAFGSCSQRFHFRTASDWQSCLARHGLHAEVREMSEGTPFANVLLMVTTGPS